MRRYFNRYPITRKKNISGTIVQISFKAEEISNSTLPGQFIQIRVSDNFIPLWPRPFSVFDIDKENGEISIILKIAGSGTNTLAEKKVGDSIGLLGPLGNGFEMPSNEGRIIMAAGGVGMPPLYLLSKQAIENGFPGDSIIFISGARSKAELFDSPELSELNADLRICTDDGSAGEKGTVVDVLNRILNDDDNYKVYR